MEIKADSIFSDVLEALDKAYNEELLKEIILTTCEDLEGK